MRRGTTSALTLILPGIDPEDVTSLHVTFQQGNLLMDKQLTDTAITLDPDGVKVILDQEETLLFKEGVVEVQVRGLLQSGFAFASQIMKKYMDNVLLDGVIEDDRRNNPDAD